ncbi:inositol monophosphatase [Actinospica sp.]|uniref:inositol monophosphatase family protein n=1 Tax=Actinospica sp. TaxID=1872142 RepID=UPI002B9F56E0|nr:inositol monophosphatase [Actinospica sp.]HWG28301.1 inositol monophosphatase [Actinospica sp.]
MLDDAAVSRVAEIIREVSATEILPRFGRLEDGEIVEKGPGDLVTVADRASERELTARLRDLLPGSRVVGEEAVFEDPGVLDALDGPDPVWIIDPIDGTENYANANARFTVLVALARGGELQASWIYEPCFDRMAHAVKGGGAYLDGEPLRVAPAPDSASGLMDVDVSTSRPKFWNESAREAISALSTHGAWLCYSDGAGLEYVTMADGRRTCALMVWENVWDHAAGLLLHAEAGGFSMTSDGMPFRLAGGNALPFVVAPDAATAKAVLAATSVRLEPRSIA